MQPGQDLSDRLQRALEAAGYLPGERIGSERELAERFGVTRSAVRTALEDLERSGQVRRTIGRAGGVFAWDGKVERHLNTLEGVPTLLRQQGFTPTTTVLHAGLSTAEAVECRALRLEDGATVFRLTRRRDADGTPLSLDVMSLPLRRFPGFQDLDHEGSVYQQLQEHYGVEAAVANETIDVVGADPVRAAELRVDEGAPLLSIRRVTYDQNGLPFEFAHDHFIAARTRITLRRTGARWKRAAGSSRIVQT
jgi:GntR family transcriptional regulator